MLLGRREPELTLGKGIGFKTRNRTTTGIRKRFRSPAAERIPGGCGDAIQNHAPEIDLRVQPLTPKSHGCSRSRHFVTIQDQNHRGFEQFG